MSASGRYIAETAVVRVPGPSFLTRAIAAALVFVVCGGAVDWGHIGGDDADCNAVVVPHDHAAHRFAANRTGGAPTPDHCYLCHSLRLLHVALVARHARTAVDLRQAQIGDAPDAIACQRFSVCLSSRAPPSQLL
jgi:hypothetical protein